MAEAKHEAGLAGYADRYFEVLSSGEYAKLPLAPEDCVRIENGVQTVLRTEGFPPGSPPSPATMMGVAEQVRHNATRHIAAARDRGMYVMDPSRGLVMIRFFFDHQTGAGLHGLLDEYYAALAAGRPGLLPLAADVRFTENGQQIAMGTGLWATATGAADSRVVTIAEESHGPDGTTGQVAGWGMVTEGGDDGDDALLGVRLKTTGKTISEVETLVVRRKPFGGDAFPASLARLSQPMMEVIDPSGRGSRGDLVKAANGYLDGVARDDAGLIPAEDDCVRIENGLQTVLNTEASGFPPAAAFADGLKLGVLAQIETMAFRYIEDIRDRRFVIADTARGLVLACCFFDHPGQLRGADFDSPIAVPNSMLIWEMFKVSGGLIRRIEAIGAAFPYGMRHGW